VNLVLYYFPARGIGGGVRSAPGKYPAPDVVRAAVGGFCERGLPVGGLWVSLNDLASSFNVTTEGVRRWRQDPTFPTAEAVAGIAGRPLFNVVRVLFWRIDKARSGGRVSVAEAVAIVDKEFQGLPVGPDGQLRGLFS